MAQVKETSAKKAMADSIDESKETSAKQALDIGTTAYNPPSHVWTKESADNRQILTLLKAHEPIINYRAITSELLYCDALAHDLHADGRAAASERKDRPAAFEWMIKHRWQFEPNLVDDKNQVDKKEDKDAWQVWQGWHTMLPIVWEQRPLTSWDVEQSMKFLEESERACVRETQKNTIVVQCCNHHQHTLKNECVLPEHEAKHTDRNQQQQQEQKSTSYQTLAAFQQWLATAPHLAETHEQQNSAWQAAPSTILLFRHWIQRLAAEAKATIGSSLQEERNTGLLHIAAFSFAQHTNIHLKEYQTIRHFLRDNTVQHVVAWWWNEWLVELSKQYASDDTKRVADVMADVYCKDLPPLALNAPLLWSTMIRCTHPTVQRYARRCACTRFCRVLVQAFVYHPPSTILNWCSKQKLDLWHLWSASCKEENEEHVIPLQCAPLSRPFFSEWITLVLEWAHARFQRKQNAHPRECRRWHKATMQYKQRLIQLCNRHAEAEEWVLPFLHEWLRIKQPQENCEVVLSQLQSVIATHHTITFINQHMSVFTANALKRNHNYYYHAITLAQVMDRQIERHLDAKQIEPMRPWVLFAAKHNLACFWFRKLHNLYFTPLEYMTDPRKVQETCFLYHAIMNALEIRPLKLDPAHTSEFTNWALKQARIVDIAWSLGQAGRLQDARRWLQVWQIQTWLKPLPARIVCLLECIERVHKQLVAASDLPRELIELCMKW